MRIKNLNFLVVLSFIIVCSATTIAHAALKPPSNLISLPRAVSSIRINLPGKTIQGMKQFFEVLRSTVSSTFGIWITGLTVTLKMSPINY